MVIQEFQLSGTPHLLGYQINEWLVNHLYVLNYIPIFPPAVFLKGLHYNCRGQVWAEFELDISFPLKSDTSGRENDMSQLIKSKSVLQESGTGNDDEQCSQENGICGIRIAMLCSSFVPYGWRLGNLLNFLHHSLVTHL